MPDSTAQGDDIMPDVLNVRGFYGLDVCGDFLDTCERLTFMCPRFFTFSKAMVFQLSQLFGDLIVQLLLKPLKLRGDLVDATADFTGLGGQLTLLMLQFTFDAFKAFSIFTVGVPTIFT
ncbi:Sec-independent translocase, putative [Babesia ovata]|uniref:Sec-independent translocase, putative n=1 Tax=Babesia ovata TaxID=189622 RepID=A0A2H6KD90_9APIC|nr:Sec-independent translocase, putative [Babesia ovata]GBE60966.1 Sec-independent translocase, putative [Babesia ovata]